MLAGQAEGIAIVTASLKSHRDVRTGNDEPEGIVCLIGAHGHGNGLARAG